VATQRWTTRGPNRCRRGRECASRGRSTAADDAAMAGLPRPPRRVANRGAPGVVLLEVVLAMTLFFLAAGVIVGGLNSALRAVQQVRLESQGADLAVTLLSEIQMGLMPIASDGPNAYQDEELAGWTWQTVASPADSGAGDGGELTRVEVVVANSSANFAYRLAELLPGSSSSQQGASTTTRPSGAP